MTRRQTLIIRLPGVVYYLSTFYTRGELAGRVGIFYSMSMMANAFSGLLAFGVSCLLCPSSS